MMNQIKEEKQQTTWKISFYDNNLFVIMVFKHSYIIQYINRMLIMSGIAKAIQ